MLRFEELQFEIPKKGLVKVSGAVKENECVVLTGPTGCGKTTLLRVIAGLESFFSGKIFLGEKQISGLTPQEIRAGLVFQDGGLWADFTVKENLSYGFRFQPKLANLSQNLVQEKIDHAAKNWGIDSLLERFPSSLSGGEKQVVAFVRALLADPPFFLLDEAWSALDPSRRESFLKKFKKLLEENPKPTLWVSHHADDLSFIATRVVAWDVGNRCISF